MQVVNYDVESTDLWYMSPTKTNVNSFEGEFLIITGVKHTF